MTARRITSLLFLVLFIFGIASLAGFADVEYPVVMHNGDVCVPDGAYCTLTGTASNGLDVTFSTLSAFNYLFVGPHGIQAMPGPNDNGPDNSIDLLLVKIPGYTFTDLVAGIYGQFDTLADGSPNNTILVHFTTVNNASGYDMVYSVPPDPNGATTLSFFAPTGDAFTSIQFGVGDSEHDTGARFYALQDVSISGPSSPVPEPAGIVLLGSGLLSAGATLRRRKR